MARNFPFETHMQAALAERYTKENDAQFSYYLKQKQQGKEPGSSSSKQMEVFRRRLEMNAHTKPEKPVGSDKPQTHGHKVRHFDDEQLEKATFDQSDFVEMRPASCKTKSLLYDGFSKEGKGKKQYLRSRNQVDPEKKFQYPVLSSMEYGWKIREIIPTEDIKKPPHGRTRLIEDTFYARNGVPLKEGAGLIERAKTVF